MERSGEQPSQRRLADHTGLEPIYVSKLARALERSGVITRTVDPTDTRAVRLALIGQGREIARDAVYVVRSLQDRLTAPLGGIESERTTALMSDLQKLLAAPLPDETTDEANGDQR